MDAVFKALFGAVKSLVHPIILTIVLMPMVLALTFWAAAGWAFWDICTEVIRSLILDIAATTWAAKWDLDKAASWIATAAVVAILIPAVILTSILIATLFAMPLLVRHVSQQHYPRLARRRGGTTIGSVWNAVAAVSLFALVWIATLPLWLLGPLAVILPLLLSANLNQRLFRYDALSEHADASEMNRIFAVARGRLFLLGIITGVLYFIPPFSLLAPVFSALAFIHLGLSELEQLRAQGDSIEGHPLTRDG